MPNPRFHSPISIADAQRILAQADDPALLAGGQWLVPLIKSGKCDLSDIVSLHHLDELRGVRFHDGKLFIGAGETHRSLSSNALILRECPALAAVASEIGDPATRNRGTIGGAIASDARRSDYSGLLCALDGEIISTARRLNVSDLFEFQGSEWLQVGEILTAAEISVPNWGVYEKIPHPAANYAEVGLFIGQMRDGSWRVVASTGKSSPMRLIALETELAASVDAEDLSIADAAPWASEFDISCLTALLKNALENAEPVIR